jgi:3-methyladenine DNA glycosylase AlkD
MQKAVRKPARTVITASAAVAALKRLASDKVRQGMTRFGLPSDHALGVAVGDIQRLGKRIGRSQELAEGLWRTGIYEARLLAAFVGEPEKLTVRTMDRWCADFDNWAVVDTVCFKLFDQTPHAWGRVERWSRRAGEFQKRAGFVMLACLAAHAENASEEEFIRFLPLVEWGAADERNFVKKGVSWALRMMGLQGPKILAAATETASCLAASDLPSARWVGKDALRQFRK